jgi:hypothetical protein
LKTFFNKSVHLQFLSTYFIFFKIWQSLYSSAHGAQINFRDLTPYDPESCVDEQVAEGRLGELSGRMETCLGSLAGEQAAYILANLELSPILTILAQVHQLTGDWPDDGWLRQLCVTTFCLNMDPDIPYSFSLSSRSYLFVIFGT